MSSENTRNECHINMVKYSSESLDDKEVDMCVAEWSWGSKSKPFICSSLKLASKSQQDGIRYTFDVTKCDRIFITCYKENKLNYQVVKSYRLQNSSNSMHIINDIILILMLLMIAIFSVGRFNQP
jgi:hypothetical protein